MSCRNLVALVLDCSLFINLPGSGWALDVPPTAPVSPDIMELHRQFLETDEVIKSFLTYLEHVPNEPISRDYQFALLVQPCTVPVGYQGLKQYGCRFRSGSRNTAGQPVAFYDLGQIDYAQHQLTQAAKLLQKAFRNTCTSCSQPSGRCSSILPSPYANQANPRRH